MRFKDFMRENFVFEADFGRGHRRRRKMFGRGDMKFVILQLISEKPMHGYEVMSALEDECRGFYRPSPGTVYPTLQMLEDQGLLRSEEVDGKRVYSITEAGQAFLGENEDHVEDIFGRFDQFTGKFGREMRELAQSFSQLARETFESAYRWTEDSGFMTEMKEILDEAQEKMAEAAATAREARRRSRQGRRGRSDEATAEAASSDSEAKGDAGPDRAAGADRKGAGGPDGESGDAGKDGRAEE